MNFFTLPKKKLHLYASIIGLFLIITGTEILINSFRSNDNMKILERAAFLLVWIVYTVIHFVLYMKEKPPKSGPDDIS
jgi:uncharacterized membrane protein HdeD (DUF308 family)